MLTLSFTILGLIFVPETTYTQAATQAAYLESKYGIEAELTLAIIKVESNFKINAVGRSHHEVGLMQLRPDFFPGVKFDVKSNLEVGVRHLAQVRSRCQKKYGPAWFVCYNIGHNRSAAFNAKAAPYYKKVMAAYVKEKRKTASAQASIRNRMRAISSNSQASNP